MDTRTLAYKFLLRPRKWQRERMHQWCAAARYAWNWALSEYETALDEARLLWKAAEKDEKVASVRDLLEIRMGALGLEVVRRGDGTRTLSLGSILYKLFCHHRDTTAPDWVRQETKAPRIKKGETKYGAAATPGGHSHVGSYSIERLEKAIQRWWKAKRKGVWITASERAAGKKRFKRKADVGSDGLTVGAPRYKRYGVNPSFTIQVPKGAAAFSQYKIHIPVLGPVYVDDRADQNPLDIVPTDAVAKRITVREVAGEWVVSVCVAEPWVSPDLPEGLPACGIDLGINAEATIAWSDGRLEQVEAPRPLLRLGIAIQLLSRKLSYSKQMLRCRECGFEAPLGERHIRIKKCPAAVDGATCGGRLRKWRSNRGLRIQARLAKLHVRIARIRADHLHKLSQRLVQEASVICTEPHNVTGLVSEGVAKRCAKLWNKGIRRKETRKAMLDIGWGEFRRQLEYKAGWYTRDYVTLPKGTATDQVCWCCGETNKMPDNTSDYVCGQCKWSGTRQQNTALLCLDYVHKIPGKTPGGRAVTRQQDAKAARLGQPRKRVSQRGPGVNGSMDDITPGASVPGGSRKKARKVGGSARPGARASSTSSDTHSLTASGPGEGPLQQ